MLQFCISQYKPVNLVLRSKTPIDEFYYDECSPSHSRTKAVVVSNPLYVIFNQKRLLSIGQFALQEWIDSMNSINSDPLQELRSKVSDEDLVNYMRSRYCQKPSEIAQWSAYLADKIGDVTAEVQQYIQAQQSEKADVTEKVVEPQT